MIIFKTCYEKHVLNKYSHLMPKNQVEPISRSGCNASNVRDYISLTSKAYEYVYFPPH